MKTFRRIRKFSKYLLKGEIKRIYLDILEYRSDKLSVKANQQSLEQFKNLKCLFINGITLTNEMSGFLDSILKCVSINENARIMICTLEEALSSNVEYKIIYMKKLPEVKIPGALFYWVNNINVVEQLNNCGIPIKKIYHIDLNKLDFSVSRFFLSVGAIDFDKFLEINSADNPFAYSNFLSLTINEYYIRNKKFISCNHNVIKTLKIDQFNGLRHTIGWVGTGLSYKYLFYKAKQFHIDQIMLCEDDVLFKPNFIDRFEEIKLLIEKLPEVDIFNGFMVEVPLDVIINQKLEFNNSFYLDLKYFVSMVFAIYNCRIYDGVLSWDENNFDKTYNTVDRFISSKVNNVIVPVEFLVSLNDTDSTLWSGIDTIYKINAISTQKRLSMLYD